MDNARQMAEHIVISHFISCYQTAVSSGVSNKCMHSRVHAFMPLPDSMQSFSDSGGAAYLHKNALGDNLRAYWASRKCERHNVSVVTAVGGERDSTAACRRPVLSVQTRCWMDGYLTSGWAKNRMEPPSRRNPEEVPGKGETKGRTKARAGTAKTGYTISDLPRVSVFVCNVFPTY